MLMLTRRAGERILVGDDIVIEIAEIQGGRVRVGIIAPRETLVIREELLQRGEDHDSGNNQSNRR